MSRQVAKLVYDRKIGSMLRKAVLAYFAERANDDGSMIWASKKTIADEIECSKQAVINTVKQFVEEGILRESGHRKTQGGFTVIYDMNLAKIAALPRAKQSTEFTGQNLDQSTPLTEPVNHVDPDQSTTLTQTVHEPSIEPSIDSLSDDEPISEKEIVDAWNFIAAKHGLPKVAKLTADRKRKLAVMRKQSTIEELQAALGAISRCKWMHGENDRGWRADFDFFLQPKSFTKLIEGSYDQKPLNH
jgi:Helix-turn-helix domain